MSEEKPPSTDATSRSGWWARLFPLRGDELRGRPGIIEFLTECRERGLLAGDEHTMLKGVLEVSETQVRDIMIPRSHMVVLDLDEPPELFFHDAKRFLGSTDQTYDLIVDDIPPAKSRQIALTYTREFFTLVKERLNPGGIFSMPTLVRTPRRCTVLTSPVRTFIGAGPIPPRPTWTAREGRSRRASTSRSRVYTAAVGGTRRGSAAASRSPFTEPPTSTRRVSPAAKPKGRP